MKRQTNIFRVFVSSTFTDMTEERNILQKMVFPTLQQYCRKRGARFQAVDLRWGVNEESQLNQKTLDICLNEIRRCQVLSPKPNFLILLGDKYGWQPIPSAIPENEMEEILAVTDQKILLNSWYRLDENAIPPEYVLQPRGAAYIDYKIWEKVEKELQSVLRSTVDTLSFNEKQREKYYHSATHQEIMEGAFRPILSSERAEDQVLAMIRETEDLPDDKSAGGFIDLIGDKLDTYSRLQLAQLKAGLKKKLGNQAVTYKACWRDGKLVHADLADFAEKVRGFLQKVIDDQLFSEPALPVPLQDSLQHEDYKKSLTTLFCGRKDVLNRVKAYLENPEQQRTLLVTGLSGSGKTSILAKSIEETASAAGPAVIFRFLGLTSGSSSGMRLFNSINLELDRLYGESGDAEPQNLKECLDGFRKKIARTDGGKPLIIYLDGIDRLPEEDSAPILDMLVHRLPSDVKIIASCDAGDLETAMRMRLPAENIVLVPPMNNLEGREMLLALLNAGRVRRQCTEEQGRYLLQKFEKAGGLPLYLKLWVEVAATWHSYDPLPASDAGGDNPKDDIPGMIRQIFNRIRTDHGEHLVNRTLAYLAGVRKGITESELIELLWNRDPWLRKNYFEALPYWTKTDEMPFVIWSRLYMDLRSILNEKQTDGVLVLDVVHPQVKRIAALECLDGEEGKERHLMLAGLFEDTCGEYLIQYLPDKATAEIRRAIGEFAYHYRIGNHTDKLKAIYSNLVYWCNYVNCQPAFDLLTETSHLPEGCIEEELQKFIQMAAGTLFRHPQEAPQLLYKELNAHTLKEQVAKLARRPWIKADRIPIPAGISTTKPDLTLLMSQETTVLASCVASSAGLAFLCSSAVTIEIVSVTDLKPCGEIPLATHPLRTLRKLLCNNTGSLLTLVFDEGQVEMLQLIFNPQGKLLSSATVHSAVCLTGRFGSVAAFASGEEIVYQESQDTITFIADDGRGSISVAHQQTGGKVLLQYMSDEHKAFVWKENGGCSLEIPVKQASTMLPGKVLAMCRFGNFIAVSHEGGDLFIFSWPDLVAVKTIPCRLPVLSMSRFSDKLIYMTDKSGGIVSLSAEAELVDHGRYCMDMYVDYPSSVHCCDNGRLFYLSNRRCVILSTLGSGIGNIIRVGGNPASPDILTYSRSAGFELSLAGNPFMAISQTVVGNRYEHEYLNFRIAWSNDGVIVYTDVKEGIVIEGRRGRQHHFLNSEVIRIVFNEFLNRFIIMCHNGKMLMADEFGELLHAADLPSSTTGIYLIENCGQFVCVVSQQVLCDTVLQNRFTETVLSLFRLKKGVVPDPAELVVCKHISNKEPQISGLSYSRSTHSLFLVRDGMIEQWSLESPQDGHISRGPALPGRNALPFCGATDGGYYVSSGNQLTFISVKAENDVVSLPCFRPVTFIDYYMEWGYFVEHNQIIYTYSTVT